VQQSVQPMPMERLAEWLRCPNCAEPLFPTAALTLGCSAGHRFDVNKRGYITLVSSRNATAGDTAQMLADRADLLHSGAYAPIVDALTQLLPETQAPRVLDAGCGSGYYLSRVLDQRPHARALALDRSPAAVRMATRSRPNIVGLVADTWEPLPIRDGTCDVILNVFAPRNPAEFARVVARDGSLLVVVPRPDHLSELRAATDMLSVPEGKAVHVEQQLSGYFSQRDVLHVQYGLALAHGQAELLRQMGPSAHHDNTRRGPAPSSVTVSVDVIRFEPL
jgi:23S rRNA (guanine745-N1)-methyltransferase